MKKNVFIICISALSLFLIHSSIYADAFSRNRKLGRGINMGNMLEAPSEGSWGPSLKEEYFRMIADKGFNSVRIPVRWSAQGRADKTVPYTISDEFFQRADN